MNIEEKLIWLRKNGSLFFYDIVQHGTFKEKRCKECIWVPHDRYNNMMETHGKTDDLAAEEMFRKAKEKLFKLCVS